ncbi:DNA repair protein RecO [Lutibacter sp. TH_r2]|uniref:DNA repair protein RecO n=1 Tax=Lutibacter sp. TH_r2 TaxID=3082083 RepID=UPI0029541F12|nr:DNA repair protein RecO [Lutibacter sp. TH_r2]MDV7186513.1 DNA repair protein RecO [Lutibacter sp. TH_r2]
MLEQTKAIVLHSIKYGDSSLITTCYTEKCGVKSYMLKGVLKSRKSKIKPAYFQPLTQLVLTVNHNNKGALNSIREVEIEQFYTSIHTDIKKQTIALFLAEILNYSIKEEELNSSLYQYLEASFLWLDTHSNISNFHLLFLLNLTKFLGFYPDLNTSDNNYFDLYEARFTTKQNHHTVSGDKIVQFKKLLGIHFDAIHTVNFNAESRQVVLSILIQYFELHLSGFRKPKSLQVLKSIFS